VRYKNILNNKKLANPNIKNSLALIKKFNSMRRIAHNNGKMIAP